MVVMGSEGNSLSTGGDSAYRRLPHTIQDNFPDLYPNLRLLNYLNGLLGLIENPEYANYVISSSPVLGAEKPLQYRGPKVPKVVSKKLPKGVKGATPIKCDRKKCVPAGDEVYVDPSQGDVSHAMDHEITHYDDLIKNPYIIQGIAERYKDLIEPYAQKYGPEMAHNLVIALYEGLTDLRTIQNKCRNSGDCATASKWYEESGYKPIMDLIRDIRGHGSLDGLIDMYNEIGRMKAEGRVPGYQQAGVYPEFSQGPVPSAVA
jgi:hypothetical protein